MIILAISDFLGNQLLHHWDEDKKPWPKNNIVEREWKKFDESLAQIGPQCPTCQNEEEEGDLISRKKFHYNLFPATGTKEQESSTLKE